MAKEKNKPVPVRFNLKLLEVLKEEEKIDTPQQALNFLANFWENNRPAREDLGVAGASVGVASGGVMGDAGVVGGAGSGAAPGAGAKVGVSKGAAASKAATGAVSSGRKGQDKKGGDSSEAPAGLSGIDLSIWKAEQREKNKEK